MPTNRVAYYYQETVGHQCVSRAAVSARAGPLEARGRPNAPLSPPLSLPLAAATTGRATR